FFQAEDGIRDFHVTGVQTCALPIWKAMRKKYRPLVDRVHSRAELSDLIAQMVSELSALHIFVRGGDVREVPDRITLGSLGAVLEIGRASWRERGEGGGGGGVSEGRR